MIKINYPYIPKLINDYLALPIFSERQRLFDDYKDNSKYYFNIIFYDINFKELLCSTFEENLALINKIKSNILGHNIKLRLADFEKYFFKDYKKGNTEQKYYYKKLLEVFQYDGDMQQNYLSVFFEEQIEPKTCYYCNIDFINVFASKYSDKYDFLNNASFDELMEIKGIGEVTAKDIIDNQRPVRDISSLKIKKSKNKIISEITKSKIERLNVKNSFTLDHFLEKSEYPYLALSLFNLVPSCYTCNSKLKGTKFVGENSPTQINFDFKDRVKFKVFINTNYGNKNIISNLLSVKSKNKIQLRLKENAPEKYKEYIEVFRLNARYNFHKYIVDEMIKKREKYPDSKIKELAKRTKQSAEQVKKDLFGDLYENDFSKQPFSKLKRDIAEQLGLI